ncbi:MAG: hypothetical protein ACD_60C00028G0044 [uncultured bacterium]|nr:MAG: hypothetical protein ACD_60C00028G0044 [uncultured bacterium]
MDAKIIFFCVCTFLFTIFMTWVIRCHALRKAILDIPNERSSHRIPTPRGGGIAIVLSFLISLTGLYLAGWIDANFTVALIGGGLIIAITGYCDDIYSLKARSRILLHILAAMWALYWLGGFPVLDIGIEKITLPHMGYLLALITIIWCTNFYNFMDGIDGLAGSEGIFVALASGIALSLMGAFHLSIVMYLLTASILGFTVWNWPPAKIFLGDVGSGFLGFVFAVIALHTANQQLLSVFFWLTLSGIFLWDATFTLLYRALRGKRWYEAHREHAYQHLIALGANHKQVTISITLFNCCLLLPMACVIFYWPAYLLKLTSLSILSLGFTWIFIKSLSSSAIHINTK